MFKNTATNNVDYIHELYVKHEGQVSLCRNLFEGLDSSLQYLYQSTNENEHDFRLRQQLAILDPIFERIVTSLVGECFRKEIEYPDVPDAMRDYLDELGFETILRNTTANALVDGKSYLMVDLPADKDGGGKPYIINVFRQQLINWRKDIEGVYSMTVIRELYAVEEEFKLEYQPQFRHIIPNGNHNIWRKSSGGWEIHDTLTTSYDNVPLYECDLSDNGIPPNYDLALASRKLFNDMSMTHNSIRKACDPSLLTLGLGLEGGDEIKLGVNSTVNSDNSEASMQWIELKGESIPIAREDLESQKQAIAERALQLQGKSLQIKTATQVSSENSEKVARLNDISTEVERMANKVYGQLYRLMYNQEPVGEIVMSKDFETQNADSNLLSQLTQLWLSGAITHETLLQTLQDKELLVVDVQDEIKAVQAEGMANVQEQDKSED